MTRQVHGRRAAALVVAAAALAPFAGVQTAGAADGTIAGMAFKDLNRDGVKQTSEEALVDQYVWLFDAAGAYLRNARTDGAGRYQLTGVTSGAYTVEYWAVSWNELARDWTPSTTGSIHPSTTVHVTGSTVVDFGFRPIVRSTDPNQPVSTYRAPSGLTVRSFNDVVTAGDVYAELAKGALVGGEAATTVINFDLGTGDHCVSRTTEAGGHYSNFSAGCNIDYRKWLEFGDTYLFHEYGHAWAVYHQYIVQQNPSLAGYLVARGIDPGDTRLGTSHAWSVHELLAEDYRTLFGSPTARTASQENTDLPPASTVAGLREYLSTTFMTSSAPPPPPDPVPSASHVGDLDAQATSGSRNWTATVTVTVKNESDQPVPAATVSLAIGSGKQAKTYGCTTLPSGRCAVAMTLAAKVASATLSVTAVAKPGLPYTPSANTDPDGDSNGTTIVVSKPA